MTALRHADLWGVSNPLSPLVFLFLEDLTIQIHSTLSIPNAWCWLPRWKDNIRLYEDARMRNAWRGGLKMRRCSNA